MKKIYLFLIAITFVSFDSNAQLIEDDFELYVAGPIGNQNPDVWRTWSGTPSANEDLQIISGLSNSGEKSGFIGGNGTQDVVLQLGNLTSGFYTLGFQMYLAAGSTGYFNIQGEVPSGPLAGVFNSGNIFFNELGTTPGQGEEDGANAQTFTYPEDTWFPVVIEFDVDLSTYQMSIDGNLVHPTPVFFTADNTLGGIDFFSLNDNTAYNIDDVIFVEGTLSSTDFEESTFKAYPNPVQDRLNIETMGIVNEILVYNVLGKVVLQSRPDSISPSIDMSNLNSGAYLVNVTIDEVSKTIKVLK